jgi:hypothetical protein
VKSDEFIREVDEELRRDRLALIWRRWGTLILGGALLIVAATAAKVGWDHWQAEARAAEAVRFAAAESALRNGSPGDAAAQFAALAAEGDTGFAALARLREAEARLGQSDTAGAVAALNALAGGGAGDPTLQALGRLLAIERQLDTGDPDTLRQQLEPLAAAGAPWRNQARELLALVAIRTGSLDEARGILVELGKEVGVTPSQQRRAAELLEAIGGAPAQASS